MTAKEKTVEKKRRNKKKAGPLYHMYIFMESKTEYGISCEIDKIAWRDNFFSDRVKKLKDLFNQIGFAFTVIYWCIMPFIKYILAGWARLKKK